MNLTSLKVNLLEDNELMIHFSLGTENLYAFFITSDSTKLVRVPYSVDPRDLIGSFLKHASEPSQSLDELLKESTELYKHLGLDQFQIEAYPNLIIVPDHDLNLVPFDLLLKELPGENESPDFLIKNHNVLYANSATVLNRQIRRKKSNKSKKALAFAPFHDEEGLSESSKQSLDRAGLGILKWTRQEVEGLSRHFTTDIFVGNKATKAQFRESVGDYSIVHIASHGVLDLSNPMQSQLVFAGNAKDGGLSMSEVINMKINADMVVLSACDSGVGEVVTGEGVIGLANSFIFAGSKSLVTSLWTANDQSSAYIMNGFYENLSENQSKSEALRNAKLAYLEDNGGLLAHPYYWAHFVVNGNDRPLVKNSTNWYYWAALLLVFIALAIAIVRKKSKIKTPLR